LASLAVDDGQLLLCMTARQKAASFHGDLRVPLTAVRSVGVIDQPWLKLRGRRMAGLFFPGSVAMGTWIHGDGYDFCVLRKAQAAVRVDLATGRFSRWVVGATDLAAARAEAQKVAAAAGIAPDL
jgi:hypothetical protein